MKANRLEAPTRRIRPDRAAGYALQLLEGLSCLHYAGIVHRDIKPHNLLLSDDDTLKICDFGLSKLHGDRFAGPPQLKVGSPGYAAPEQQTGPDRVDPRADLYAAGVVHLPHAHTATCPTTIPGGLSPSSDPTHRWTSAGTISSRAPWPVARNSATTPRAIWRPDVSRLAEQYRRRLTHDCLLADIASPPPTVPQGPCPSTPHPTQGAGPTGSGGFRARPPVAGRAASGRPNACGARTPLVHDPWTGAVWQRAGSPYPLTWPPGTGLRGNTQPRPACRPQQLAPADRSRIDDPADPAAPEQRLLSRSVLRPDPAPACGAPTASLIAPHGSSAPTSASWHGRKPWRATGWRALTACG